MSKTIADYTAAVTIDASNDYLLIEPNGDTVYNKINRNVLLGISGDPIGTTDSQSISNKTIGNTNTITAKDSIFTIQDNSDATKQAQFQASGITTGTTRTLTIPDANTTIVGTDATQTLTNKTLTSPTITGGSIDNSTITVDSISGHTSGTVVTVANLQISNGVLNTNNSVVTANVTDGAITPAKLVSGTGSGWTLSSWTTTWTNLTVGNGTATTKYVQIGKLVFCRVNVIFGTTTSISGAVSFTLPVTSVAYPSPSTNTQLGFVRILDSGTAAYYGSVNYASTTSASLQVYGAGGTYVNAIDFSSTVPMTWTQNDAFAAEFFYEAA